MLQAYFDETGTHDQSELVAIVGLISTDEKWQAFDVEWRQLLSNVGIASFHATECNAGRGSFAGLPREIRDDLFKNLTKLVLDHVPAGVEALVLRTDWDALPGLAKHFRDPYHFCFESCMHQVSKWSKKNANGEQVELTFANQDKYATRATEVFKGYKTNSMWKDELGSFTFARAKDKPALQAADLIAFEFFRHISAAGKKPEIALRPSTQLVLSSKHKFQMNGEVFSRAFLETIVQFQDLRLGRQQALEMMKKLNVRIVRRWPPK
jgi:Protein of unknown function (DUF3800)